MLIKHFISIVMCMLMTMQMLPIAQIGKMLSQNQWTEELPHNCETGKIDGVTQVAPFLPPVVSYSNSVFVGNMASGYIHTSATIPSNHSTDVVSPPPDCI